VKTKIETLNIITFFYLYKLFLFICFDDKLFNTDEVLP